MIRALFPPRHRSYQLLPLLISTLSLCLVLGWCVDFVAELPQGAHAFVAPSVRRTSTSSLLSRRRAQRSPLFRCPGVGVQPRRMQAVSVGTETEQIISTRALPDVTIMPPNTAQSQQRSTLLVARYPPIHWTVPGYKVGWRDSQTGQWCDVDGPRNGPPLNHWRQSTDESQYLQDMQLADALLLSNNHRGDQQQGHEAYLEQALQEHLEQVVFKNSARFPSLNRKLLGTWAPLLQGNRLVASAIIDKENNRGENKENGNPSHHHPGYPLASTTPESSEIRVSATIRIQRTAGRKFAPRNHYGRFDAALEEGESLNITLCQEEAPDTTELSWQIAATKSARPIYLHQDDDDHQTAFHFGSVVYISDYLWIQRRPSQGPDGHNSDNKDVSATPLLDVWDVFLRCDELYLGQNNDDE